MARKEEKTDTLQLLKNAIRQKAPGRFYIFYGEESFLLHHYLGLLRKILIDELTEAFNYHKLTNETFDIRTFCDAVENLPMMSEHTLVWVDDIDLFKLPEADRERLAELFADIPEYCTIIFTYQTLEWKPDKRQIKYWRTIESNASIVAFEKQSHRDLSAWITRHFAARNKNISQELCTYLIDITGGTMTALAGEISKIAAYSGADTIRKSDIDAVTEPVLDAIVFQMTDLLGEGAYGPALLKLRQLLKMEQEPISILGAIGAHFRRISTARTLLDNGKSASELMRLYSIGEYPAKKTMAAAKRFSAIFCARAAELVLDADYRMKTSYDDPDRLLEALILELSREARND